MKGYDFDKTIYKNDSSTEFFVYMIFSRPYLLLFAPWFLIVLALYGMKLMSKKRVKECLFFFVPWYSNIDRIVDKFWSKNANKIQDWYAKQKADDDIVISASLSFIIKPVMEMLNIKNWIATNYSVKTGKIYGDNCYGEAKKVEFDRLYKGQKLEAFYSDSLSDMPMMKLAEKAYLVDGENVKEIDIKDYDEQ